MLSAELVLLVSAIVFGWQKLPWWSVVWSGIETVSAILMWLAIGRIERERIAEYNRMGPLPLKIAVQYSESAGCTFGIGLFGWTITGIGVIAWVIWTWAKDLLSRLFDRSK